MVIFFIKEYSGLGPVMDFVFSLLLTNETTRSIEMLSENEFKNRLSDRVRRLRGINGMTQGELAEACGIAGNAIISQIESGRQSPRSYHMFRLANALNVPVEVLAAERPFTNEELKAFVNLTRILKDKNNPHRKSIQKFLETAAEKS